MLNASEYLDNFDADIADMDRSREERKFDLSERPIITTDPGRLAWTVDAVEAVILNNYKHWSLYQHGQRLVRVVPWSGIDRHINRTQGSIVLQEATAPMLQDIFSRAIDFRKVKPGEPIELAKQIDCPAKIANIYLSRNGLWRVPSVTGTITAPAMRPDGSIILTPGFDEETGLILESAGNWQPIPSPTAAAVKAAVACLLKPFGEFPFVSEEHRSVVASAILTGLQRRLLHSAPAHAFDAPAQGTGKSLLSDGVSLTITGRPPAKLSYNRDEEESRKKLMASLLSSDQIVCWDNVTSSIRSDTLATILTEQEYTDRILGLSKNATVLTNSLFLITGNNLSFSGDMPSRVIVSRIVAKEEKPEERSFAIPNLRAYILGHRVELVTAALTILQAYYLAGRPSQGLKPFGRFEQWSDEIRSAIVWADLEDPCLTRNRIVDNDPERDATLALYTSWHDAIHDQVITAQELIRRATELAIVDQGNLRDALLEICSDRKDSNMISSKRLGTWFRDKVDRNVGGFTLTNNGVAHGGAKAYRLIKN